ncbi:transposase (IS4), partial [mine drainage metagenome]
MAYTRVKPQGDRFYLCEYESYWDPKMGRSRQRFLRYLGPCDRKGNVLSTPQPRVGTVHSAFPVGPLAVFYAAAQQLRVQQRIQETLGMKEQEAALVLALGLNQAAARVPILHLPGWFRASPLPGWLSVDAEALTPRQFEDALFGLCHLTPEKTWEDRGLLLQQDLNRAWRNGSRE